MRPCDQCQFFFPYPAGKDPDTVTFTADGIFGGGECRRRSPDRLSNDDFEYARFPVVSNYNWCGGYKPRDVPSEFVSTFLVDPSSVACDADLPDDIDVVNTESTPHTTSWASWAAQAVATWQHAEDRSALHV